MRLWSDKITAGHLRAAMLDCQPEFGLSVWMDIRSSTDRARRRKMGHDIVLTGTGARHTRYTNLGTSTNRGWNREGDDKAATWMDWGWLLAVLFRFDPDMCTPYYDGCDDFLAETARMWPHRLKIDKNNGAGDFARTYAARTYASPFELVDEVIPPVSLVDLADPDQVRTWLANDSHLKDAS
jgi:hypothetical protein